MRRLLAALFIVILAHPLAAQSFASAASIRRGDRVRITLDDGEPRVGVVVGTAQDTLLVRWPEFSNGDVVPLAQVSLLEVSRGGQRNLLKGAGMGIVVGAGVGALAAAATARSGDFFGKGEQAAMGGMGGALLGLFVGTLGALWRGEDWHVVSPERHLGTVAAPRTRGFGVALSLH